MPTPPDKISIQIYRDSRAKIADIEVELMKEWSAAMAAEHEAAKREGRTPALILRPTVADAVHRALDRAARADELERQFTASQQHIMDVLMPALREYHQLEAPNSGHEWADAALKLGDAIIELHEMMGTLAEAAKSPKEQGDAAPEGGEGGGR